MENSTLTNRKSRRKILYWAAGAASALMFWRFRKLPKTEEKAEPIKMLTEDGQLVEVDSRFIASNAKRASKDDIKNFVKRQK